jgi:hypothetical protein
MQNERRENTQNGRKTAAIRIIADAIKQAIKATNNETQTTTARTDTGAVSDSMRPDDRQTGADRRY